MRLALISSHTHKQARPSPSPTSDRCWKEHRRLRARARTTPGLPRQMEFIELPAAYRAVQPEYRAAQTTLNGTRKAHGPSVSRHFEEKHYANSWNLDMNLEESLGLVPKAWSTSNAMNDHRPNGHAMFDAAIFTVLFPVSRHMVVMTVHGIREGLSAEVMQSSLRRRWRTKRSPAPLVQKRTKSRTIKVLAWDDQHGLDS